MKKILLFLLLTACSATQDNPDPHKKFNQDMMEFNLCLDRNILRPTASGYKNSTPEGVRRFVSNFLSNLNEPLYCLNYILAAEGQYATNSFFRFFINSTVGLFGLFDVAEIIGINKEETSYRSTLKKWDIPTGDYLVLPILGSSFTRDAIAEPISWYADPMSYCIGFPYMFAKTVLSMINDRAENLETMDNFINNSMNIYSSAKSIYIQKYGNLPEEEDDDDI